MTGTRLENLAELLAGALAQWDARDQEAGATAEEIRAGYAAMAAIDDMLTSLHKTRGRLVSELRADKDATAARADAKLTEARARKEAGQ